MRSLDGLRGSAALLVVIGHLTLILFDNPHDPVLDASGVRQGISLMQIMSGHAVWVFFVLSGVVLTSLATRTETFDYGRYVLSRLARLYLPAWAAVCFATITILFVPRATPGFGAWVGGHPTALTLDGVVNDLFLVTGSSGNLSPLWTLQWEILFSLLLVLYLAVLRRVPLIVGVIAPILLSTVGSVIQNPALQYLPMFAIGVALSLAWGRIGSWCVRLSERFTRPRMISSTVAVVGLLVAALLTALSWPLTAIGAPAAIRSALDTIGCLVAALLVVVLSGLNPPLQRLLEGRIPQWLGTVSFSLYLVHEPIIIGVVRLLGVTPLTLALGFILALAVAQLFAHFVERPAHAFARRLRNTSPNPTDPAAAERERIVPVTQKRPAES